MMKFKKRPYLGNLKKTCFLVKQNLLPGYQARYDLVPIVTQSHTGLHDRPKENSTHELAKLSSLFSAFIGTTMFYVAYRTLLVMFCVLKFYFVDFYGMFTSSPTWRLKMHVLCKVGKNIIFQNKTLLVMFYRHNKTFWYQFCNFKHFLKAENSEDSLASSCVEFSIGLSCNQYETGLLLELGTIEVHWSLMGW